MVRTGLAALTCMIVSSLAVAGCSTSDDVASTDDPTDSVDETADESADDETPADDSGGLRLALEAGSVVTVPGYSQQGESGPAVPMEVAFTDVTCQDVFEAVDTNEFDEPVDFVAADGNQLCLVSLTVTNVGEDDGWFAADVTGVLEVEDGSTFAPADQGYDPSLLADREGVTYAAGFAGMAPGDSGGDFMIVELPADAVPMALVFGEE